MTAPHADQIIDGYLSRLTTEAADLPKARQEELLQDVREHIAEARASLANETDADILNILDRLGEPADLVEAARDRFGIQPSQPVRPGLIEIGALVLLPIFWLAGVALLWVSNAWTVREKLIGTLLPPGGFAAFPLFLFIGLGASRMVLVSGGGCQSAMDSAGNVVQSTCTTFGPPAWLEAIVGILFLGLMLLLLVLPVLTVIYLGIRLRRRYGAPVFGNAPRA